MIDGVTMETNIKLAHWIASDNQNITCPVFKKEFCGEKIRSAKLYITAKGVYKAELNGHRVGNFIMAPGWTKYIKRHQYQEYDITELLQAQNELYITAAVGWYYGKIERNFNHFKEKTIAVIAEIVLEYNDGTIESIKTDESWQCGEGKILTSDIYDGESCDGRLDYRNFTPVRVLKDKTDVLIPQEGEIVIEHERIKPVSIFKTPKGETVVDFGQNITGYPEIEIDAKVGDVVDLSFAEVLDKDGNFYNENYRDAKSEYRYICRDGKQVYKPSLSFYGFRYIRINSFSEKMDSDCFTAIAVYSDIKRIGSITFENDKLNQLYSNVIWSHKDNFLDIPTDCPQRDERLGWTGDANVFARAACYNFDVERFFRKWLRDLAAEQHENGMVPQIIPTIIESQASAVWGDAAVNIPWQLYMAYGNPAVLEECFSSMCKWIDYITAVTKDEFLWTGGEHYGDWLGLDAKPGSLKGSSRDDFIASAFYAYSTQLVIKAGKAIKKDVSGYETLYKNIKNRFKQTFQECLTQTECVLALYFDLCQDKNQVAAQLNEMLQSNGNRLTTGFVGTPYLLHALSENGYTDMAYTLLLQEKNPSWLFSVNMGATTIWEHWDGINEKGEFWNVGMNSYNHYAYGSVVDWIYSVAAGINPVEEYPGYEKALIAPQPDERLGSLSCSLETRHGLVRSNWKYVEGKVFYEIETPVEATIVINGRNYAVKPGVHTYSN